VPSHEGHDHRRHFEVVRKRCRLGEKMISDPLEEPMQVLPPSGRPKGQFRLGGDGLGESCRPHDVAPTRIGQIDAERLAERSPAALVVGTQILVRLGEAAPSEPGVEQIARVEGRIVRRSH
jgi:hypothetical protein